MTDSILSNLIITKIFTVSTIFSEAGAKASRKNRNRWAIIHKFEGETVYISNGNRYVSNKNSVMILPKGCSYDWYCIKAGHFSTIEFECELSSNEIHCFKNADTDDIQKIINTMEARLVTKETTYNLKNIRDIYSIILKLSSTNKKAYTPSSKAIKLEPALRFIAENITKTISNDELAARCGISTVYFRKLFTEVYKTSPINYIHKLKISKAKEMLKSDYCSITEIAASLGYSNIYDFSRDFKRVTGISPSEYVKASRN